MHIGGGESVWDACGKGRLQAQKGQRGCSESRTGYCAGENYVELGLLPKGLQQKTVREEHFTKQNKTSLTFHAFRTD